MSAKENILKELQMLSLTDVNALKMSAKVLCQNEGILKELGNRLSSIADVILDRVNIIDENLANMEDVEELIP